MGRFYVAGSFADEIIVERDKNLIEKRPGGPAHFISGVLGELGEDYEVASGKKGICEIHLGKEGEIGRVSDYAKVALSNISAQVVIASSSGGELELDSLKGDFSEIYVNAKGFVHDPENFGGKRKWELKNVEKVAVLHASASELDYVPGELLSHLKSNGVIIVSRKDGSVLLSDRGTETEYRVSGFPLSCRRGLREALFAAFSCEYAKIRDAKRAMEFAVEYSKEFLARGQE